MPKHSAPGLYVQEVGPGPRPIQGGSTSTAGFLGPTERGPESPRPITSWSEYQRWYGGYVPDRSYLAYAVQGFFENGGLRCYVGRIAAADALAASGSIGALNVWAIGRGSWGNQIRIKVQDATRSPPGEDWFRVQILYDSQMSDPAVEPTAPVSLERSSQTVLEEFDSLTEQTGARNNVVTAINASSRLVRVAWADPSCPERLPNQALTALGTNGSDGSPVAAADFVGDRVPIPGGPAEPAGLLGQGRGLAAFATIGEISLLIAPDEVRRSPVDLGPVTEHVIEQCETLKDRFALVSAVEGTGDPQDVSPPRDTSYAAFYYPWIQVYDPTTQAPRLVPPTGHVAGIYGRTDLERGVHKAPANEVVCGARALQRPVTRSDQEILNPKGVNCIRDFRSDGRGLRLWGARTMSSDPEWKYVNLRRLSIFIEESIDEGTQWVIWEPNDESTWTLVRHNVTGFMRTLWRNGVLMGTTEDEAFFVKCDRTTMTQDDIDNGRLICYLGFAPLRPAELIIARIQQKTASTQP